MSNRVIVKPIVRQGFKLGLEKHGFNKFPGTGTFITPLPDRKTGVLRTGLSKEDREHFEKELGVDLAPGSSYWDLYNIILEDKENYFDPENAADALAICVMKAHKQVANSQAEFDSGKWSKALFVIEDKEAEAVAKGSKYQQKMDAFVAISSASPTKRKQLLTILIGKDYEGQKEEFIKTQLMDFIENPDHNTSSEKNIHKFNLLNIKSDDRIDVEYLITIGTLKNIIRRRGDIYYRGDKELGFNFEAAVDMLLSKAQSETRLQIQNELLAKV